MLAARRDNSTSVFFCPSPHRMSKHKTRQCHLHLQINELYGEYFVSKLLIMVNHSILLLQELDALIFLHQTTNRCLWNIK